MGHIGMREHTTKSRLKYVSSCRRRAFATFSLFEPNNSRLGNEILSTLTREGERKKTILKKILQKAVALKQKRKQ
jgi:hypothetical protein